MGLLLMGLAISCAHPRASAVAKSSPPAAPPPDPFTLTAEWKPEEAEPPQGFWARIKSPSQLLLRFLTLADEPSLKGFSDLKAMSGLLLGGELSALIDFDAPIDLALVRGADKERAPFVVATQLNDAAHFAPQRLGEKLQSVSPGRWKIDTDGLNEHLRCELWHAALPIGYRVVCGADAAEIASRAPFLLGLAARPLTSDARFESAHYPLQEASRASTQEAASEQKAESPDDEAAKSLAGSLMSAESLALDLNFAGQNIELSLALKYLKTGPLDIRPGRLGGVAQPIPPQFWQVHALAPVTVVSSGVDDRAMVEIESWGGVVQAFFEQLNRATGVSPELAERVEQATGELIPRNLRFVISQPALASTPLAGASKSSRAPSEARSSPCLEGFAGSGERYRAGLDVLFDASKAKPLQAGSPTSRWMRLHKGSTSLPAESILLRTDSADGEQFFSLVLPTPEWIWVLTAPSRSELLAQARRLLSALSKPAQPDPVALAALAPDPLVAITVKLASIKNMFSELSEVDFAKLPSRGATPIFIRVTGEHEQQGGQHILFLNLRSHWSPAAIADVVSLIKIQADLPGK